MKKQFQTFYNLGYNDNSIATATGSKPYTVGKWRRENSLPVNKLIDRYGDEIKLHVSKGLSNKQISKLIPCSAPHIFKIRRELGIPASPHKRIIYDNDDDRVKSQIIVRTKARAKIKGRDFSLSINDIELTDTCPYLGIKLIYHGSLSKGSASIDRIDNSKGYVPGNIMMISYLANTMKNSASNEELLIFCKNAPKLIKTT